MIIKLNENSTNSIEMLSDNELPWYTEYFAVGPGVYNKSTREVLAPEDFDDYWEDFESAMNNSETYSILPIIFGPSLTREYTKDSHDTLEDALDYVIENVSADADISTCAELFDNALMDGTITDNSATFIVEYAPDVQDCYGCYIRVSQKPLGSNQRLGKYYLNKQSGNKPSMLADLMDTGLVSEDYSLFENFDKTQYAWQAK